VAEDAKVAATLGIARAFERDRVGEAGAYFHPDATVTAPPGWPEKGPFRGRDQIVAQFKRLTEDYPEQRTKVTDIVTGEDRLVGKLTWEMRARASGIEGELEVWFANRYEGDLIVETNYVWTREEALRAAGMED
jgi:hypothetical protein